MLNLMFFNHLHQISNNGITIRNLYTTLLILSPDICIVILNSLLAGCVYKN